jgi:TRAP-type C4-dicarboxylate transport system substrate-binding protein
MNWFATARHPRKTAAVGLSVIALSFGMAACGSGAEGDSDSEVSMELRFASPLSESAPQNILIQAWSDAIEEKTDGRISVKPFYDGSLIAAEDSLAGVADRRADLALGSAQYHPGELPLSSFTELPFVTRNSEAQAKAIHDAYESEEAFPAEYHAMNTEVMLFVPTGQNVVVTNKPMESIDDMDGLSMRAVGRTAAALEAVGASPKSVPIGEAYEGLERGLFDAVSSISAPIAASVGILDAAPHVYDAGFGEYTVSILVAGKEWYDDLSDDDRAAVEEATEEFYAEMGDTLSELESETCTQLLEDGVEFTVWPDTEVQRWDEAAGEDIRAQWTTDVSKASGIDAAAFLEAHMERVGDYESESDYEPLVPACAAQQ